MLFSSQMWWMRVERSRMASRLEGGVVLRVSRKPGVDLTRETEEPA